MATESGEKAVVTSPYPGLWNIDIHGYKMRVTHVGKCNWYVHNSALDYEQCFNTKREAFSGAKFTAKLHSELAQARRKK